MAISPLRYVLLVLFSWVLAPLLHAQPGLSRSAARLIGFNVGMRSDSSLPGVALPIWFPVEPDRGSVRLSLINRYGLGAMTELVAALQCPLRSSTIFGDIYLVGDGLYRMHVGQVGLSKKLVGSWHLRADLGYTQVRAAGYGSRGAPRVSLSFAGMLDPGTWIGAQWENPQALVGRKSLLNYSAPRVLAGMVRAISDRLAILGWMEWEPASGSGLYLQGSYRPGQHWSFDLGWGRAPDQLCLGVQRLFDHSVWRTAFSQDPVLGASFLCSYSWLFRSK